MSRRLWVLGWVAVAFSWPLILAFALIAVWADSGRFGGMAGVLLVAAAVGTFIMGAWTDDGSPAPNLSRAGRKQLRAEQRRIALDKAIQDAEREAGLT